MDEDDLIARLRRVDYEEMKRLWGGTYRPKSNSESRYHPNFDTFKFFKRHGWTVEEYSIEYYRREY
jgi:hypothetical protein